MLEAHAERMQHEAKLIYQSQLAPETERGTFFAPRAYEIASLDVLEREVFGPVLHVVRFNGQRLDQVVDAINRTGMQPWQLSFSFGRALQASALAAWAEDPSAIAAAQAALERRARRLERRARGRRRGSGRGTRGPA